MPIRFRTLLFPWVAVLKYLFNPLIARQNENLARVFLPLVALVALVWFVTVPVHELLHVAGCLMFGGSVDELTIQPMYGGALLAKVFPFVTAGGDYAGQLTGFDTAGSDLCYFATDFFPFLLTVFFGVPLLVLARRKKGTVLQVVGFVQIVVLFVSIPGDFYEMGSIVMTRLLGFGREAAETALIRGDDVAVVLSGVREAGVPNGAAIALGALGLGIVFQFVTLDASLLVARCLQRKPLEKMNEHRESGSSAGRR
jgi:hypothetical protein